jgi:glycosyltransferase involved in cell wall biosynthesis
MNQKNNKVTVLQHRLLHYRVTLFEELKKRCQDRGITLSLVHGQASATERIKKDEGYIPWADRVNNKFWRVGGKDILWQPLPQHLRDSDLLIVMQENRILSNYPILLRGCLGKKKVAYWGHGINFQSAAPKGLREKWKQIWLTNVDWWFAYTDVTVQLLLNAGFSRDRITCLNNAMDTKGFRRDLDSVPRQLLDSIIRKCELNENSQIGLFCGSLYPDKKLGLLIFAADLIHAEIPEFKLIVIGDGPSAKEIQEAFKGRSWAHWVGVKKGIEKAAYFKMAKVILNPGLIGLHILDAFCAGLPIFSTTNAKHSPEIAYLRNGENGFLTNDTADDYANAVINLLKDPGAYQTTSQNALADSAPYSVENMVDNFAEGISRALMISK